MLLDFHDLELLRARSRHHLSPPLPAHNFDCGALLRSGRGSRAADSGCDRAGHGSSAAALALVAALQPTLLAHQSQLTRCLRPQSVRTLRRQSSFPWSTTPDEYAATLQQRSALQQQ